jgi:putative transposase
MSKQFKRLITEIEVNQLQKDFIDDTINLQRAMWNKLVEVYNPIFKSEKFSKSRESEMNEFLREEFKEWLNISLAGNRIVRGTVIKYIKAWQNHLNKNMKSRLPKFHSYKDSRQSVYFPDTTTKLNTNLTFQFHLKREQKTLLKSDKKIKLKEKPQIFERLFEGRFNEFKAKEHNLIRRNGKYYISICFEYKIIKKPSNDNQIGLDWGLKDYFIDNNGNTYNLPKSVIRQQVRISKLQRILANKVKGSKNFVRVKEKLNNAYLRQSNIKKDWIEKFTYELCSNYNLIVIEDLDLIEMRSKGFRKRRYYMNINSFSNFKECLKNKIQRFETDLVFVDKYFPSSQICSKCGHSDGRKPLSQRTVSCSKCDNNIDRDVNAAINILQKGRELSLLNLSVNR